MVVATDKLTINGWLADLHARRITRAQFDARLAAIAYERGGGSATAEMKINEELQSIAKAEVKGEKKNKPQPGIPQKVKGNGTLSLKVAKPTKAQVKRALAAAGKPVGTLAGYMEIGGPRGVEFVKPNGKKGLAPPVHHPGKTPAIPAPGVKPKPTIKQVAGKILAERDKDKAKAKAPKEGQRHCPHCGKMVNRGERCPDRAQKGHREMKWTK